MDRKGTKVLWQINPSSLWRRCVTIDGGVSVAYRGALDGAQCRMSNLRNGNVPIFAIA